MLQPAVKTAPHSALALLTEHYPLARAIAKRTHARLPRGVDLDDLTSVAVMGLMEAADRFDPSRGVCFKSFAKHRIQGAIIDTLRANDWVPRSVRRRVDAVESTCARMQEELGRKPTALEVAARLELDVEQVEAALDADTRPLLSLDVPMDDEGDTFLGDAIPADDRPDQRYEEAQIRAATIAALGSLPEREQQAITMFYFRELPLKEVGAMLGVSESRACQLCSQGTKRLREALRAMVA